MIFIEEKSLLFIEIPKSASSSIAKFFFENTKCSRNKIKIDGMMFNFRTHDSIEIIQEILPRKFLEKIKIGACVRNPWDRIVSAYYFYRNGRAFRDVKIGTQRHPKIITNVLLANLIPFGIWVYIRKPKSCTQYIVDKKKSLIVDYLFKMEELHSAFPEFCLRNGIRNAPLSKENQTKRLGYWHYYSESTKYLIQRRYKDDICNFGYTFD